jgi:hypothetical protein
MQRTPSKLAVFGVVLSLAGLVASCARTGFGGPLSDHTVLGGDEGDTETTQSGNSVPAPTGSPCSMDVQCQARCLVNRCGPISDAGGPCDSPADCEASLVCSGNICVQPCSLEPELCGDAVDNNCDGRTNEGCASQCGQAMALADDFEDGTAGTGWEVWASGGTSVAEVDGGLAMTPGDSGGEGLYRSQTNFDFIGSYVLVELVQPFPSSSVAAATFLVADPSGNDIQINQSGNELVLGYNTATPTYITVATLTFDAVAHRWWRIREAGGVIYWDLSPDGVAWSNGASVPTPFASLAGFKAGLRATYSPGPPTPGTAVWDNFNGGDSSTQGAVWACNTASITDDFEDGDLSPYWATYAHPGALVAEANGALELGPASLSTGNAVAQTESVYSLRESAVSVRVAAMLNTATSAEVIFTFGVDGNDLHMAQAAGVLECVSVVNWGFVTLAQVPYDPVAQRFWRLRESAGMVFCETSPDGVAWVVLNPSTPTPASLPVVASRIAFSANNPDGVAGPGVARFDDVNRF